MNLFNRTWDAIFNTKRGSENKGRVTGQLSKLSKQQCDLAAAVFGDSPAQCGIDYAALGKRAYKAVEETTGLGEILENFRTAISALQEDILALDEAFARMESERIQEEKEANFFTPRGTKAMYGTDWIGGASVTRKTSKNRTTGAQNDWVDSALSTARRSVAPHSQNYYTRHDLRMGKTRI